MNSDAKSGAVSAERSGKLTWTKWFPRDWVADERLARCSVGARGVWIECLNRMMLAPEPGFLLDSTGERITNQDLAFELRATPREINKYMSELERNRVFSKDDAGRIYSRRLVREAALYHARVEGGKRGGEYGERGRDHGVKGAVHGAKGGRPNNPPLPYEQGGGYIPPVNPPLPPGIPEARSQKPEARSQKPVSEASADAHTPSPGTVSGDSASPAAVLARQCASTRPEYAGKFEGFYGTLRGFIGPDAILTMAEIGRVVDSYVIEHRSVEVAFEMPEASLRTRLSDAEVKKQRLQPRPRLDAQPSDDEIRLSRGRRNDFNEADDEDDEA